MVRLNSMKTILALAVTLFTYGGAAAAVLDPAAVNTFISDMESAHGFDRPALEALFREAERSDRIVELMSRPAEKVKPWWQYRKIFISDKRIRDGARFWRTNADALQRAEEQYGVAPAVIVAIIGVETSYGRVTGGHRVIDALGTLAFHYPGDRPKRAAYFRAQLEHFLLFTREAGLDPLTVTGSYAGAMGMPQFMPENYRKLAVDFDADGSRDIWNNPQDAIGSVANYLNHHGWERGGPIMTPARLGPTSPVAITQTDLKPASTLAELAELDVAPMVPNDNSTAAAALYELEAEHGTEYWIGYSNFYVISRYNPRLKYTMAVAQLADAILDMHEEAEP